MSSPVIRALAAAQRAMPDQRLCQIISNAVAVHISAPIVEGNVHADIFYITDADLENALYRYAFKEENP
jgi:hypothetical protein